jgi:hypothetical protein
MSLPKEWRVIEQQRSALSSEAVRSVQLTDNQSRFLDLIIADTLHTESASLHKVKAVLEIAQQLQEKGVGDGKMLYVGAGRDWRFPVALGGRDIVMLGIADTRSRVMADISSEDRNAVISGDSVSFATRFSDITKITFVKADVAGYRPEFPVKSLLEYAGPTKLPEIGGKIATELIAQRLGEGVLLLNFDNQIPKDLWDSDEFFNERGIDRLGNANFRFAQIKDPEPARKWMVGLIPDRKVVETKPLVSVRMEDI